MSSAFEKQDKVRFIRKTRHAVKGAFGIVLRESDGLVDVRLQGSQTIASHVDARDLFNITKNTPETRDANLQLIMIATIDRWLSVALQAPTRTSISRVLLKIEKEILQHGTKHVGNLEWTSFVVKATDAFNRYRVEEYDLDVRHALVTILGQRLWYYPSRKLELMLRDDVWNSQWEYIKSFLPTKSSS